MKRRISAYPVLCGLLMTFIFGCQKEQPPIKIGLVSNFTIDKTAPLSIDVRNGAFLAVDGINASGGIHGREIELIVKDDLFDSKIAVKVDQELIQENVAAIIGHFHSNISMAVLPTISQAKTVMISPSSASGKLSGIDDYFFKINPPTKNTSILTATYAYNNGIKKVMVLYDLVASNYTEVKFQEFKEAFEARGGQVAAKSYTSKTGISFPDLAADLVKTDPDGYFIIASHYDTAMVCQHLRKIDATGSIFISPWAYHQELIQNGGTAVEGAILAHSFQRESQKPAFLAFRDKFFQRYKTMPGMWGTYGYEAVYVLYQALSKNPAPKELKATLLGIGRFKGLQGDIIFDRYGDNQRKPILLIIRNGAFVEIQDAKNNT